MSHDTFDASTRFFKSFVAGEPVLHPVDEVNAEEIDNLVSFYAATYDEAGRLAQLRKFLHQADATGRSRQLVFTEDYEYGRDGELRCRRLVRSDGGESRWVFEDAAASTRSRAGHDRLSALEDAVLCSVRESRLRGRELSREMWEGKFYDGAVETLRSATDDPGLALEWCILDKGSARKQSRLSGPADEFPLGAFLSDVEPFVLNRDTPLILPSRQHLLRLLPAGERAFAESGIRAAAVTRIRMRILDHDQPIAMLAALTHREWTDADQQCVGAMLRRIALFFEILLEFGRREDQVRKGDLLSPPGEDEQTGEAGKNDRH